jgi:integrase
VAKKDLTDKELLKLSKAPPEKKKYIREGKGFAIRIMPSGAITFLHIYTFAGKRKEDNLGHYPHVSLADARRKHRANLDKLEDGTDPQAVELVVAVAEPMTIDKLVEEYCAWRRKPDNDGNVLDKEGARTIEKDILPAWSGRLASSIRRADAIKLIEEKALVAGKPGQGRNIRKNGNAMFRYAMHREYVENNPFLGVAAAIPAIAPRSGKRNLSDEEIKTLWNTTFLPLRIKVALLLMLSTCQRPGEVIGMHTDEIDEDWWTIPFRRIKTRRTSQTDHRVFLSPFAKRLIESLGHREDYQGWLFPGKRNNNFLRETSVVHEINKEIVDANGVITRPKDLGLPSWHPHDLRRTASTKMTQLRIIGEYRKAILNHSRPGMDGVYNIHEYDDEKKESVTKWGEYLANLVGDTALDPKKDVFDIDSDKLSKLVWRYPLTRIAIDYGISEAAVRKRCNKYGIDRPSQGYWLKSKIESQ